MPIEQIQNYRFGYSREEIERLRNQHRIWDKENQQFLDRAGFRTGETLVDLGCGPGFTTLELARLVGPEGRIIAVDRDGERSLPLLREQALSAGYANIETVTSSLETFDLPVESVDGVYGRWVLMYLTESAVAELIHRVAGWLRPGGKCALAEFCNFRHIHIHPPSVHLAAVAEALIHTVENTHGSNPEIGNKLPSMLLASGLEIEQHVVTKTVRATTPGWQWPESLFRDHLHGLVDEGYLSREVLDEFLDEWEKRSQNPGALFFGSPVMEAIGRRV